MEHPRYRPFFRPEASRGLHHTSEEPPLPAVVRRAYY
jgi:hypothetical protein